MEDGHARGLRKAAMSGEIFSPVQGSICPCRVCCSLCRQRSGVAGAQEGAHRKATGCSTGAVRASVQDPRVWGAGGGRLPTALSARSAADHRGSFPPGGLRKSQDVGMRTAHTEHTISFTSRWDDGRADLNWQDACTHMRLSQLNEHFGGIHHQSASGVRVARAAETGRGAIGGIARCNWEKCNGSEYGCVLCAGERVLRAMNDTLRKASAWVQKQDQQAKAAENVQAGQGLGIAERKNREKVAQAAKAAKAAKAQVDTEQNEAVVTMVEQLHDDAASITRALTEMNLQDTFEGEYRHASVQMLTKAMHWTEPIARIFLGAMVTQAHNNPAMVAQNQQRVYAIQCTMENTLPVLRITSPQADVSKLAIHALLAEMLQATIELDSIRGYQVIPGAAQRTESVFTMDPNAVRADNFYGKLLQRDTRECIKHHEIDFRLQLFNDSNEVKMILDREGKSKLALVAKILRALKWQRHQVEGMLMKAVVKSLETLNAGTAGEVVYCRLLEGRYNRDRKQTYWMSPHDIHVEPPGGPTLFVGLASKERVEQLNDNPQPIELMLGQGVGVVPIPVTIGTNQGMVHHQPGSVTQAQTKLQQDVANKVARGLQKHATLQKLVVKLQAERESVDILSELEAQSRALWVCLMELPQVLWREAVDATKRAQNTMEAIGKGGVAAGASQEHSVQQLIAEIDDIDTFVQRAERSMTEAVVYAKLKLPPAVAAELINYKPSAASGGRRVVRQTTPNQRFKEGVANMLRTSVQLIAVEMVWMPNGMIEPEDARVVIALLRAQQGGVGGMGTPEKVQLLLPNGQERGSEHRHAVRLEIIKQNQPSFSADNLRAAILRIIQTGGTIWLPTTGISDEPATYTTMTAMLARHPLAAEEGDSLPFDIRMLHKLWPELNTEHILFTLGQLRVNKEVVAVEVAADAQQGKRAGYMLPEIDRFLHEHQTDWKEMLPYGSATADTVQNLLSTHRLVLVEKELAAGLWVSGTTAGELPERGDGQQQVDGGSWASREVEGVVIGPDRLVVDIIQKIPVLLGQEDAATMGQSIILALTEQGGISITHVAQHTLLLPANSGYLQSVRSASNTIVPGRSIPFATLQYSTPQRQAAATVLKFPTESRVFLMARRGEVALRYTDAAWTKVPSDNARGLPVLRQVLPVQVGQVGVVAGELLDELQRDGSIVVAEGSDCWVVIQAACLQCPDGTRVPTSAERAYGRKLPSRVQAMIGLIRIGQDTLLIERLAQVEKSVCVEAIRALPTPFYIPVAEVNIEEAIITRSWSSVIPLPLLQTDEGRRAAQDAVLDMVNGGKRATRSVQEGVIVLNPDTESGLDALAQGDEAWGKVDFTEPNPIAALMAMIAKRDRESAVDAGDLEEHEQQAQESEKWVMLGQGEESDGTPPKGGEERDAEMSGEAVSREKRDRAEEADKREDPEGDENMRTEEEVAQAGKKKRQGNSPETEK